MILASDALPDNAGYVAAAYLVFLALLLIYVGIMAYKLGNVERDITELNQLAGEDHGPAAPAAAAPEEPSRV
jgi:hypothetical protein